MPRAHSSRNCASVCGMRPRQRAMPTRACGTRLMSVCMLACLCTLACPSSRSQGPAAPEEQAPLEADLRSGIAYEAGRNVFISSLDGSKSRFIEGGLAPAWSPTGDRIAYLSGPRLMVTDLETFSRLTIGVLSGGPFDPMLRWAPDGSRILISGASTADSAILLVDMAGNTVLIIGLPEQSKGCASWANDGEAIYLASSTDCCPVISRIWRFTPVRIDGRFEEIVTLEGSLTCPVQAPNRDVLVYGRGSSTGFGATNELFESDLSTGQTRQLLSPGGHIRRMDWSPDGRRIVFELRESTGRTSLQLLDLESGMMSLFQIGNSPDWSPLQ